MKKKNKHAKTTNQKWKICIIIVLVILILIAVGYFVWSEYQKQKAKQAIQEVQEFMDSSSVEGANTQDEEKIGKLKALQEQNPDIKAWIKIEGTQIHYPILQSEDNEYYLTHNYKKEKSSYGSIYLKNTVNIENQNANLILYGHNMKDGEMFQNLLNYKEKSYWEEHKNVTFVMENEVRKYEIIAVFPSRIFYQNEKNVFRYYNYTSLDTQEIYQEYIENINAIKLYDTGITAQYPEPLLTMITCEYSQENGRMVVVAKQVIE